MPSLTAGPDQLLSLARAFRPTPAASGALFFASDLAGVVQTYRLEGRDRFPLRQAAGQDRTLPVAPTPYGLLVRQDRGGDEIWQLALVGEGGLARRLTRDANAIHRTVCLAPDGRRAGLAYNPGGRADWALGVLDLAGGEITACVDRGGYWSWLGWSDDGRTAAVARFDHTLRNRAFLLRPERPHELRPLLGGARLVTAACWARGRLYALSSLDGEFVGLVEVDPEDPERVRRPVLQEEHDVLAAVVDPEGRRAAVVVAEGAYDSLRVIDLESGRVEWRADRLPQGVVYADNATTTSDHVAWSLDGDRLFVAWESPVAPAEIYELPSGARWTAAGGEPPPGLRRPEPLSYRSFDGLEIPALHYRADPDGRSGGPAATVVWFHGGPEGQLRGNFQPVIAMWNAAGCDVLAPNVRGSTGYGMTYAGLDDKALRWDSVRDGCEAGREAGRRRPGSALVAMGGSYGGFMTLAVLVEAPELWAAGVDVVGIADWRSFFRNTSGWRRSMRTSEYGDPENPDEAGSLAEFSPLGKADRIRAQLLIIHGRNDPRVPLSEAEQIHRAVAGSELMVFDDEGHGIVRHGNRVRAYGRALAFLSERLAAPPG